MKPAPTCWANLLVRAFAVQLKFGHARSGQVFAVAIAEGKHFVDAQPALLACGLSAVDDTALIELGQLLSPQDDAVECHQAAECGLEVLRPCRHIDGDEHVGLADARTEKRGADVNRLANARLRRQLDFDDAGHAGRDRVELQLDERGIGDEGAECHRLA